MNASQALTDLISERRIVVCCGSGGVGKTTTAAAIAMAAALEGKRAIVVTIDPAKRLATSLGLKKISDQPENLTEALKKIHPNVTGEFFAVIPEANATFRSFLQKLAPNNNSVVERVLKTSIYKIFARDFSGAHDYMAMEKLFDLYDDKRFDLIVLDTPPAANTKSFLEAPLKLKEFFDDKIIRFFVTPSSKLLAQGVRKLLEILEKLTGEGFITDLIEFAAALFELREQFNGNLEALNKLFHQQNVAFLMVSSPERFSKDETQDFAELLRDRRYPFWGFFINRSLTLKLGVEFASIESLLKITEERLSQTDFSENERISLLESWEKLIPKLKLEKEIQDFLKMIQVAGSTPSRSVWISESEADIHSIGQLYSIAEKIRAAKI